MRKAKDIAVSLWLEMEARNWDAVADLLDPSFRAVLPQSGERFDREGFLKMNRDYPGDWHIRVGNVVDGDGWIVTEVVIDGRTDRAVSFFRCATGRSSPSASSGRIRSMCRRGGGGSLFRESEGGFGACRPSRAQRAAADDRVRARRAAHIRVTPAERPARDANENCRFHVQPRPWSA
jgi:hypothetical protein